MRGTASLLQTAREASHTDTDTVHAEAVQGLEMLCGMDTRFYAFQTSLFGDAARRLDREALGPDEARALAASIAGFLRLLPGYILLRPAHTALEFLIRRFQ